MGMFSTPLLHKIGADNNRLVVSLDNNLNWLNRFILYNSTKTHKIFHLSEDDMNNYGLDKRWGLVLVDHFNARTRSFNAIDFSNLAEIVILHDAEKSSEHMYQYEKNDIRSHFKFACKYSIFTNEKKSSYVSTIILSNFINLNQLEDLFKQIKTDYGHVACDFINY